LIADNLDNHFGTNWKIVSLNTLVGVNDMDGVETELIFYPNPTSGILTISGLKMEDTLLNLYNLSGVLVKSQIVSSTNSQINLANLNQGVYIIRCGNTSQRLVLLK
jgi:hypothetical protein